MNKDFEVVLRKDRSEQKTTDVNIVLNVKSLCLGFETEKRHKNSYVLNSFNRISHVHMVF